MTQQEIEHAIENFMDPVIYTGVAPLVLIAEELCTSSQLGQIIDAVWIKPNSDGDTLSYITKFAVQGKILYNKYYSHAEKKPFASRIALPTQKNLTHAIIHKNILEQIKEIKVKRGTLAKVVQKDFTAIASLVQQNKEIHLFKKHDGDWEDPFFEIDIHHPYNVDEYDHNTLQDQFYGFIIGSSAEIASLELKNQNYKTKIALLEDEAKQEIRKIDWLSLEDEQIKSIIETLPKHPFEDYFHYTQKGNERKLSAPNKLLEALEIIIMKHMPEFKDPMGIKYIPIDNLLYLFHAIIPRLTALKALKECDIVYEPPAMLLGFEGKRELPPKFLVPLSHVAFVYQKFPQFLEACERYLQENVS